MTVETERRDAAAQIRDQLRVLREQMWLIVFCIALAVAAAGVYTLEQDEVYQAEAKVLIRPETLSSTLTQLGPSGGDPTRETATNRELVDIPPIVRRVHERLGPSSFAVNLAKAVHSESLADSNILAIVTRDSQGKRAADISNAFAEEFIAFRRASNRGRLEEAIKLLDTRIRRLSRGRPSRGERRQIEQLRDQATDARLLASLQTGDAQIVQEAGPPEDPVEPTPERNLLFALLFGTLLGIALAFLRDRLDRRLKAEAKVHSLFPGVPIIGSIPRARRGKKARVAAERFRALEANLALLGAGGAPKSLLVTSASGGDGKSTTVLNLALAMAEQRRRPVIVEADMRRPELSERLGLDGSGGVSNVLARQIPLERALRRAKVEAGGGRRGPRAALSGDVVVVPAGTEPPNPGSLLGAGAVDDLLRHAAVQGGVVLVDGPPLGLFSDVMPLAGRVEGVIVVVRLYHSRRDAIAALAEQLANAHITPVGVVVLGTRGDVSDYARYSGR